MLRPTRDTQVALLYVVAAIAALAVAAGVVYAFLWRFWSGFDVLSND